jgi:hypothetical protein
MRAAPLPRWHTYPFRFSEETFGSERDAALHASGPIFLAMSYRVRWVSFSRLAYLHTSCYGIARKIYTMVRLSFAVVPGTFIYMRFITNLFIMVAP